VSRAPSLSPLPQPAADASGVIELRGVWTRYRETLIHRALDFTARQGEVISLIGGSGSGKTTLLRVILGLTAPAQGEVRLFGESLHHASLAQRQALRRRLGMLFQQGALFSALSVYDNIAFPLRELGFLDEGWIRENVRLKLNMVGLDFGQAALTPAELSGGMIKRVALARALAIEPELLLLDEPTAGLDPPRSRSFVRLIRELQEMLRLTVVLVTHDVETIRGLESSVAVLAEQRVLRQGSIAEITAWDHPATREFFLSAPNP
jgi:phospholipid/cholesterol/gamma-HCH transport system ATP-binding protein